MTDIGTELLRLLTATPDDWKFTPLSGGLFHSCGVLLTLQYGELSINLTAETCDRTTLLSAADQLALYPIVYERVNHARYADARGAANEVRRLLKLPEQL